MSSERRYQSRTGRSTSALTAGAFFGRTLRTMSTASAEMSPLMLMPEGLGLGTGSCFECCRSLMQTDSNAWSHPSPWRDRSCSATTRWASEEAHGLHEQTSHPSRRPHQPRRQGARQRGAAFHRRRRRGGAGGRPRYVPEEGHKHCKIATGDAGHTIDGVAVAYEGCLTTCDATLFVAKLEQARRGQQRQPRGSPGDLPRAPGQR